jgi:hypothetical protein
MEVDKRIFFHQLYWITTPFYYQHYAKTPHTEFHQNLVYDMKTFIYVGFEVLTVVAIKSSYLLGIPPFRA